MTAINKTITHCSRCGAGECFGLWFPELKLKILDRIIRAGDAGAGFDGTDPRTLKAHIHQINSILEETDYRIRSAGWGTGRYRLMKNEPRPAKQKKKKIAVDLAQLELPLVRVEGMR
jgi:hypothetical protein